FMSSLIPTLGVLSANIFFSDKIKHGGSSILHRLQGKIVRKHFYITILYVGFLKLYMRGLRTKL
ncbi:MAG: hypothetical protein ACK55Z_36930, partial [bacterium]